VLARFSNGTGIPNIPDTDPNAAPRGFAVRFELASTPRRVHTDIIAQSTPFIFASNGDEALAFVQSLATGTVGDYVGKHANALAFVQAPKPTPSSFSRERFFAINAFKLVGKDGKGTYVRYRWTPAKEPDVLGEEALKAKGPNFLFDELPALLKDEGPVVFKLEAQVAEEGDVTDNATEYWPESRRLVELGTVKLEALVENDAAEQKRIIFDPVPRVQGIEPSADPLIDVRAGIYLISGKERRYA
jgi:catalase